MSATEQLMVVAPLKSLEVGQEFISIPPHMTVFPWFELDEGKGSLFEGDMDDLMEETRAPLITGGSEVHYGPENNLKARRLDAIPSTFNAISGFDVHAGVYRSVHQLGSNYDDTYAGLRWSPHVSGNDLSEGVSVQIEQLAVIKKLEQRTKLVKAVFKWVNHG